MNRAILLDVGHTVRAACERLAPWLGFDPVTLSGFCQFAARATVGALQDAALDAALVAGHLRTRSWIASHVWAQVGDVVVDVTATQFRSRSKVRVLRCPGDRYVEASRDTTFLYYEDADMLRLLPLRWWARLDDADAMRDALVLGQIRIDPAWTPASIARKLGPEHPEADVMAAVSRLGRRRPAGRYPKRGVDCPAQQAIGGLRAVVATVG